jgi:vacuolar-type H+-ATPase subunit I/STV1
LHLYEWFTKFYYGDGKEFRRFLKEGNYTRLSYSALKGEASSI